MLNISSRSWHYRVRAYAFDSSPKDLCSYFWSVLAAALLYVIVHVGRFCAWLVRPLGKLGRFSDLASILLVALCIGMLLFLLGWAAYVIWTDPWRFFSGFFKVVGLLLGFALGFLIVVSVIAGGSEMRKRYRRSHPNKPRAKTEEPPEELEPEGESTFMIVWNFLKAKKRKACPLISVDGTVGIRDLDHLEEVLPPEER